MRSLIFMPWWWQPKKLIRNNVLKWRETSSSNLLRTSWRLKIIKAANCKTKRFGGDVTSLRRVFQWEYWHYVHFIFPLRQINPACHRSVLTPETGTEQVFWVHFKTRTRTCFYLYLVEVIFAHWYVCIYLFFSCFCLLWNVRYVVTIG